MSRLDPQSQRLDDQLEELASRLLCRRWHQNQAADMKGQWHRDIERYQAATVRAERSSTVRTPSASAHPTIFRNQATSRATGPTASSVAHSPIHGSAPVTPLLATGEELGRGGNNDPNGAESGQQTNSSPASSSQQEAMLQERNHPENSSPVSPGATRETISDERESVEHTLEAPTQEQPHEGSLHAHDRRVIEGDCFICCEDLSSGGATAWCRAQCRQNFHADCIDTWHASQEAYGRRKTCPYW